LDYPKLKKLLTDHDQTKLVNSDLIKLHKGTCRVAKVLWAGVFKPMGQLEAFIVE